MRRIRPYLKYLRAVRGPIAAAVFYTLIFALTSGAGVPALIKYVFPPIFDRELDLPVSTVALIAAAIPVAFLLRAWSGYRSGYFTEFAGVRILEAIRLDFFRKLQAVPLSFLQSNATGDLLSRGLADTTQLQTTLKLLASDGIKQPAQLLAALGFLIAQAFTERGVGTVLVALAAIPLTVLPIRYV